MISRSRASVAEDLAFDLEFLDLIAPRDCDKVVDFGVSEIYITKSLLLLYNLLLMIYQIPFLDGEKSSCFLFEPESDGADDGVFDGLFEPN
jgi:hypothetical protein